MTSARARGFWQALGAPKVTRWLWLAALLLTAPALGVGHVMDDLQQQAMLRGTYDSANRTGADLYCFSLGPGKGIDPALLSWWDYDESSLCFLRPLSSWSLWIDHAFFWQQPVLTHLHSVLWFMALWFGWRRILLRYLPANIANLALLFAAMSGFVTMTTAWIAARHALVGGCFGIWGLSHCLASRDAVLEEAGGPARAGSGAPNAREALGWLLIGLGLLSSEMVLGVFGFLVAREWFSRDAARRLRPGAVPRIAAYALCGLIYVAIHGALGYGAPKYPMYLDPMGDPLTFLRAAPERLLALAGDLVLGLSAEFWLYPTVLPFVAVFSVFAAIMLACAAAGLFREAPADLRRPLRWLGVGALLSLAPCLGGMQGGRSLTIAGFPLFALIAACLVLLRKSEASAAPAAQPWFFRGWLRSLSLGTLALGAFVGNPASHMAWYGVIAGLDHVEEKALDESAVQCPAGADLYLVDASQMGAAAWYARFWLKDKLGVQNFRQLTMIPLGIEGIEIVRAATSSVTLRAIGGPLVSHMALPPGTEERIQAGFTRRYEDYSVMVNRVSEQGPVEVTFGFARALDAPDVCFFVHDDVRLYQITPPAVGGSLVVRPASPLSNTPLERFAGPSARAHPAPPT